MESVYLGNWGSRDAVAASFNVSLPDNIFIIAAHYDNIDYRGDATGYYVDTDTQKFYRFGGSHCSCFGLEDQWSPEEVSVKDILTDLSHYTIRYKSCYDDVKENAQTFVDSVKRYLEQNGLMP